MGMQEPLVSVITPIYNGAEFLANCIEGVLAQSYHNFEYILVNNCSTDNSWEILIEFAKKDNRIQIHNNPEFVNAEKNHNIALRFISPLSKYCKVVQADDGLFPECVFRMVELAEKNPSVGIVGAYGINDSGEVLWQGLPLEKSIVSGKEMCRALLLGGPYIFGTPTTTLFRSEYARQRQEFYDETDTHSDTDVCYRILQNSDFGFIHQVLIYRRSRNESLSSYSKKMNTYTPSQIQNLKTYGPTFLNAAEFEKRMQERVDNYNLFLSRNIFSNKNKEFWDFHRESMKKLGLPFNLKKLYLLAVKRILFR